MKKIKRHILFTCFLVLCTVPIALAEGPCPCDYRTGERTIVLAEQSIPAFIIAQENGIILWQWTVSSSTIPSAHYRWFHNPSEAKPVYNGKYLLVTASGGAVALIRIADKKVMYYANAGVNPHSAELLPDGNIVSASSTDGVLKTFRVDTIAGTGSASNTYTVSAAHNVVWDREQKKLYATAANTLITYEYDFNRDNPALINRWEICRISGEGSEGSHDLFPVYGEKALYWTTNGNVYQHSIGSDKASILYTIAEAKSISGGPAYYPVVLLKPTESWWSDRLIDTKGNVVFQRAGYKIYKGRWMLDNTFSYPKIHDYPENDVNGNEYSPLLNKMMTATQVIDEVYSEEQEQVREGVDLFKISFRNSGERVHLFVAEIDLEKVSIVTSTPNDQPELANPAATLPVHVQAAEKNGKKVWLGINGDYWANSSQVPGGLVPMCYFFKEGKGIRTSYYKDHTELIYKKKDGSVGIGTVYDMPPMNEIQEICGGRGRLISKGELQTLTDEVIVATSRNPRTTVGISADGKTLYFLVVDGRQPGYSAGLDLNSSGALLKALGCEDAISLDQGGSTTLVVQKRGKNGNSIFPIVNRPSDTGGARAIVNGILVIDK